MTATIPASELIALNPPKTELEEARAHLLNVQQRLAAARKGDVFLIGPNQCIAPLPPDMMREREREVLAALSWVWDAQEREAGPYVIKAGVIDPEVERLLSQAIKNGWKTKCQIF
jgi:hypothetical protein